MQELHQFISEYKDIVTIILILIGFVGFSLIFSWFYVLPIRLVWRCLSIEEHFPLMATLEACKVSAWPFKPASFSGQMRLWLELRLLRPKPINEPRWYLEPKTKRYQLKSDDEAYRREIARWKRDIRGKFGVMKLKEKEPVIEVNDVFRLSDETTRNGIKQYLMAVSELKITLDEEASFLCKVKINEGFLLPLDLLAGLMSRFSDDWDPIISSYGQMAAKSFSTLQLSIFDLWLLWGPSVPICRCDQWSGPITLQYGFGDENNSVRVRVHDNTKERLLAELRQSVETRSTTAYPALHASIVGKLWPPSSFVQGELCGAQHELLNPAREAFILEYESHAVIGNAPGSHLFYTAYVWALFVIGGETKPTLDEIRKAPWLQVVPFFEHANILDEVTYEASRLQLAHKVLTLLRNSAPHAHLWYVCAVDDSGCGQSIEVIPRGSTIRATLEELLSRSEHTDLKQRVVMNDDSFAEALSGCHLSEVLADFFATIEKHRATG
jgi:hypothetical protein